MVASTDESVCLGDMDEKEKEEVNAAWSCIYRMYNCLLALPVLSLMGAVLLLGGNFEGEGSRFEQMLKDLETSSGLLNITKHLSQEAGLSEIFWLHQFEDARAELQGHLSVTDQLLLNSSHWLPSVCGSSLQASGEARGLFQRLLNARSGVEFNETPSEMERKQFYELVLRIAVCPLVDQSQNLLAKKLKSELVYYHLLASSIIVQHFVIRLSVQCRFAPENISMVHVSQLLKAGAYAAFADLLSTKEMVWLNTSPSMYATPQVMCTKANIAQMKNSLKFLIDRTTQAQGVFRREAETLLKASESDLFARSCLVMSTVVALSIALYVFGSTSRRSREMARDASVMSARCRSQSERKERALDLCLPRSTDCPTVAIHGYSAEDNYKVSTTVLAFEMPGLAHVVHDGDCSAALWALTHIMTLVEEKVYKHQAFVLQQQAAACVIAAVSNDVHCSSWPLCSIADLALDLMTSLADVELTLTSDSQLRPRFGIHTGMAIGYIGIRHPERYCLVGDVVSTAVTCQRLSEPNCIRLSWNAYCALLRLGQYLCIESEATTEEDSLSSDSGAAFYLAGKKTCRDEGLYQVTTTTPSTRPSTTPWVFHYI